MCVWGGGGGDGRRDWAATCFLDTSVNVTL